MFLKKGILLLLLLLLLNHCSPNLGFSTAPKVENGILNLTFWDFEKNGIIPLEGNWEIYWKKLYNPNEIESTQSENPSGYFSFPGFWNDRMFQNEI